MKQFSTLYHSFPRRATPKLDDTYAKGLSILRSILRFGLLVTPEVIKWQVRKSVEPTLVSQKRACFTALDSDDLNAHARVFGPFAIGFERKILEGIGATPVFYAPRDIESFKLKENIGSFYIEKIFQIKMFLYHNPRKFSVNSQSVSTDELINFTNLLTGLFYPLEDTSRINRETYYSQREWRVLANLYHGKMALSRLLSDEEKATIKLIDQEFFDREISVANGRNRRIDLCAIISHFDGILVRDSIKCVVAPLDTKNILLSLLKEFKINPIVHWL